jgi:Ala-tRNA(Pro) deacylase
MVPRSVVQYLRSQRVPFLRRHHPPAMSAQVLAERLHVSGHRVAKCVLVEADGQPWIAVLPAAARVDREQLGHLLMAGNVRMMPEREFCERFPGCEPGAEPPFGGLFGLPVVVDERLSRARNVWFPAGAHDEAVELRFRDFCALEWPLAGAFAREPGRRRRVPISGAHAQA